MAPPSASSGLYFRVLGPVEAVGADGVPVHLGDRQRLVLALLLVHAGETVSVGRIAEALWGDDQPTDPAGAVQTHVSRLRRSLTAHGGVDPGAAVSTAPGGYCLHVAHDAVDASRFQALADQARRTAATDPDGAVACLDAALELWHGTAYEDVGDHEFAMPEATRLDELRRNAEEDRADALLAGGRASDAAARLEGFVISEPARERAHELLMHALYDAGRHADALRVYERHRRHLAEEVGVEPSPVLRDLERAVLDHTLASSARPAPSSAAPTQAPAPVATAIAYVAPALPVAVTTFVGRSHDVGEVTARLDRARLVTLVGAGGVGKTRLALEVANAMADRYPDGMWWCELAHVTSTDAVAAAVASTLGVEARAGTSTEDRVVDFLVGRRALVVVDNCEHVLDAAAGLVERFVTRTATVDVLATSQERLAVPGEHLWAVEPLTVDDDEHDDRTTGVGHGAAVALFLDRAAAVAPGLDDDDLALVAEICRRLDGMPLAIELTAARLRARTLREIADGLDERFDLLARGPRVGPERHRSLRAAVEWSYALLEPLERVCFTRLSVFVGGFDEDAAKHVVTDDTLLPGAVPGLLDALVDKSLVTRSGGADARYQLLETLRAYGHEQLRADGSHDDMLRRHADHYLAFAAAASDGQRGPDEVIWARRVDQELANLRAVHTFVLDADDLDAALRLSASMFTYAYPRMRSEVLRWAEQAVACAAESGHPLLPLVYASAATGAWQRGNLERARVLATAGLDAVDGHDPALARYPLEALGDAYLLSGRLDDARDCFRRSRELAEFAGDAYRAVTSTWNDALALTYAGLTEDARAVAADSIDGAEQLGSPSLLAYALYAAGEAAADVDPDAAAELFAGALEAGRAAGAQFVVGITSLSAATLQARRGDPYEALRWYPELCEHWRRAGVWTQQWTTLRTLVELFTRIGRDEAASMLFGALMTATTAAPVFGADRVRLDDAAKVLEGRMGHDEFEHTILRGAELDDAAAVALALREVHDTLAEEHR